MLVTTPFKACLALLPLAAALLAGCGPQDSSQSTHLSWLHERNERLGEKSDPMANLAGMKHFQAGQTLEHRGYLPQAVKEYKLAISAKPDSVQARNRLGIVYDKLARYREADEQFHIALEINPRLSMLHNNLGWSYLLQDRPMEAEEQILKAIRLQPRNTRYRVNLAWALAAQGRWLDAYNQFRSVLDKAQSHYNLGSIELMKGELERAEASFVAALEADPTLHQAELQLKRTHEMMDAIGPDELPKPADQVDLALPQPEPDLAPEGESPAAEVEQPAEPEEVAPEAPPAEGEEPAPEEETP